MSPQKVRPGKVTEVTYTIWDNLDRHKEELRALGATEEDLVTAYPVTNRCKCLGGVYVLWERRLAAIRQIRAEKI